MSAGLDACLAAMQPSQKGQRLKVTYLPNEESVHGSSPVLLEFDSTGKLVRSRTATLDEYLRFETLETLRSLDSWATFAHDVWSNR